jgi:hypothetical protein
MSLESKVSSLRYPNPFISKIGRDVSKMGSVFKIPSRVYDIERASIPVDDGSKSKINSTIPVESLPQKEEFFLEVEKPAQKIEKEVKVNKQNSLGDQNQVVNSKK